jgi:hypothetical protein
VGKEDLAQAALGWMVHVDFGFQIGQEVSLELEQFLDVAKYIGQLLRGEHVIASSTLP